MMRNLTLNGFPFSLSEHTFETSFLIFPPPRRHVVEHEFFVVSSRVETFSRGKRIHNERKLEKELFCSRFEPVESISSRRIVVRKIVQNSLSDHIRIKLRKIRSIKFIIIFIIIRSLFVYNQAKMVQKDSKTKSDN